MLKSVLKSAGLAGAAVLGLASAAQAQEAADFDVSVTTSAAIAIACAQDLSFGSVYVDAANAASTISLTSAGVITSSDASVAVNGGAVGQCTISGLQGADTASVILSGANGVAAAGGLTDVELVNGGDSLLAAIQVSGGTDATGGKTGLDNGVIPMFGTLAIPTNHVAFGVYDATLTATVTLD
jgi:hypothetical protein